MLSPHLNPVNQGNIIESDQIEKIKLGQSKEQVIFFLGSPVLENLFAQNQWDYVYRIKGQEGIIINQRLSLKFTNNRLSDIQKENIK